MFNVSHKDTRKTSLVFLLLTLNMYLFTGTKQQRNITKIYNKNDPRIVKEFQRYDVAILCHGGEVLDEKCHFVFEQSLALTSWTNENKISISFSM